MSKWRKLHRMLREKASEWEAAARERQRQEEEVKRRAAALQLERLQPVVDMIEEYLLDPEHWAIDETHSIHYDTSLVAVVPASIFPDLKRGDAEVLLDIVKKDFVPCGAWVAKGALHVRISK